MLTLGIRYLTGYTVASESSDRDCPEWPPHPRRVFMALAAAYFQNGSAPEEKGILEWIEGMSAPQISAAPTDKLAPRSPVTHYVPVNDKTGPATSQIGSFPELTRERQPRTFAKAWLGQDTVFFVWPDATPTPEQKTILRHLCEKVTRIGHSTSLVQMWLETSSAKITPNWIPDEIAPTHQWRGTTTGTLNYLDQQYNEASIDDYWNTVLKIEELELAPKNKEVKKQASVLKSDLKQRFPTGSPLRQRPDLAVWHGYRAFTENLNTPRLSDTHFDHRLIVLALRPRKSSYRALDVISTLQITSRLRDALIKHANGHMPERLSGHKENGQFSEEPHLGFLPLPFCDHAHADGHLLGIALTLPKKAPDTERQTLLRLLAQVSRDGLHLGALGDWGIESEKSSIPPINLQPTTWTAHPNGASQWGTVTPIVLDQHPKNKDTAVYQREVARSIGESCTRIGLPTPVQVIVSHVSNHLGIPPSHDFPLLRRKDGSKQRHTHALLIFDQPVIGPIFLGAGRYRGYGLCRPLH